MSRILGLIVICVALPLVAQNQHGSCQWCHTPDVTSFASARSPRKPVKAAPVCLGCHDGVMAGSPDDGSSAHYRSGLDCLACHDPHDQSGSYRLLRGRQTEQTATLQFCRECHNH